MVKLKLYFFIVFLNGCFFEISSKQQPESLVTVKALHYVRRNTIFNVTCYVYQKTKSVIIRFRKHGSNMENIVMSTRNNEYVIEDDTYYMYFASVMPRLHDPEAEHFSVTLTSYEVDRDIDKLAGTYICESRGINGNRVLNSSGVYIGAAPRAMSIKSIVNNQFQLLLSCIGEMEKGYNGTVTVKAKSMDLSNIVQNGGTYNLTETVAFQKFDKLDGETVECLASNVFGNLSRRRILKIEYPPRPEFILVNGENTSALSVELDDEVECSVKKSKPACVVSWIEYDSKRFEVRKSAPHELHVKYSDITCNVTCKVYYPPSNLTLYKNVTLIVNPVNLTRHCILIIVGVFLEIVSIKMVLYYYYCMRKLKSPENISYFVVAYILWFIGVTCFSALLPLGFRIIIIIMCLFVGGFLYWRIKHRISRFYKNCFRTQEQTDDAKTKAKHSDDSSGVEPDDGKASSRGQKCSPDISENEPSDEEVNFHNDEETPLIVKPVKSIPYKMMENAQLIKNAEVSKMEMKLEKKKEELADNTNGDEKLREKREQLKQLNEELARFLASIIEVVQTMNFENESDSQKFVQRKIDEGIPISEVTARVMPLVVDKPIFLESESSEMNYPV